MTLLIGAVITGALVLQTTRPDSAEGNPAPASSTQVDSLPSDQPSKASVPVPEVIGQTEGEAVKALAAAGLVANVRISYDAPRTGEVFRSVPKAGSESPPDSVVLLSVALAPRLPRPGQEHETEISRLSRLVENNPETFVGLYRDEAGIPHVVFGPDVDQDAWHDRLTAAAEGIDYPAEGIGYRTDTCTRDYKSLRALQDEIATKDWTSNKRLPIGVEVHPSTCTVRVQTDELTDADIQTLVDRYGTAVSIDTTPGDAVRLFEESEPA